MKRLISALLLLLLPVQSLPLLAVAYSQEAAKSIQASASAVTPLSNQDVLRMAKAEFAAETIVAQIKSTPCNFATTPAALQQLKEEGVPDTVILAMVMAPNSSPAGSQPANPSEAQKSVQMKIPNGLIVQVEAPFDINSQYFRKGDKISFRVVNPVKVEGIMVIAPGATATAQVSLAERGGHFGRAGRIAWAMQDVVAVDGTRIPLQAGGRVVGDSHGAKVATQMILGGLALGIFAPVGLLVAGFKRGENAIIPAGKRLEVSTQGGMTISAPAPAGY
jgi:hypothetical protein